MIALPSVALIEGATASAWADALAAVHEAAFLVGERWDGRAIASVLAGPGAYAMVDPLGGMLIARVAADEVEILTLGVVPARRFQGIARGLLGASLRLAAERGAAKAFLEVAAGNLAGRALYVGAGFEAVGRRVGYYPDGDDAVVMASILEESASFLKKRSKKLL